MKMYFFFKKYMLTPSVSVSEIDDSSSVDIFTITPFT